MTSDILDSNRAHGGSKHRIFIDSTLTVGKTFPLSSKQSHYVSTVLRLGKGELLTVFNGSGSEFYTTIVDLHQKIVTVDITHCEEKSTEPALKLTIALSLLKSDRFSWALQKITELGVNAIQPLLTYRSAVKLPKEKVAHRLEHWRSICISASEQSGRTTVPQIFTPRTLTDCVHEEGQPMVAFHTAAQIKISNALFSENRLLAFLGPEGGWQQEELKLFEQREIPILSLGKLTLRSETSAVVASTVLLHEYNRERVDGL